MRQSVILALTSIIVLSSAVAANSASESLHKEITQIYTGFEQKKSSLLNADINKKNAKEELTASFAALQKALEDIKNVEAKSKETLLSPEGNQIAYDLEVLEPIKDLASGIMSKEDCTKARHDHELNYPVVEDDQAKAITKLIDKICQ